jgi:pimeloyl-ACP methyl ester carboxylesterase
MKSLSIDLPQQGITLSALQAGVVGLPRVLLLHGFPEAAFIWAPVMAELADQAWLLAPDQRGYGGSSAPAELAAYRPRVLVADLVALIEQTGGPLDLLVAHDWGGALAWNLAAQRPDLLRRLLIVNATHPAPFLRALRHDPAQQAASAYMHRLCEPDAASHLAADDFAAMWAFFEDLSPAASGPGGWLDEAMKARYRSVWRHGLDGALNWYRASPLKPPRTPTDPMMTLTLPDQAVTVRVPTHVLWGEADRALPPSLLEGLQQWVPDLRIERVPGASHWIVHEQPARVVASIRAALAAG